MVLTTILINIRLNNQYYIVCMNLKILIHIQVGVLWKIR
jgi:hypothetical protein